MLGENQWSERSFSFFSANRSFNVRSMNLNGIIAIISIRLSLLFYVSSERIIKTTLFMHTFIGKLDHNKHNRMQQIASERNESRAAKSNEKLIILYYIAWWNYRWNRYGINILVFWLEALCGCQSLQELVIIIDRQLRTQTLLTIVVFRLQRCFNHYDDYDESSWIIQWFWILSEPISIVDWWWRRRWC